jgi:hypothetical protein
MTKMLESQFFILGTYSRSLELIIFIQLNYYSSQLYLNSIKSYYNDDTFNFNYGQAKAAVGE